MPVDGGRISARGRGPQNAPCERGDPHAARPRRRAAPAPSAPRKEDSELVRGDPAREAALSEGWRYYYRYYALPMLDEALDRLRRREAVRGPLQDIATVARHDRGALKWFLRERLAP
jgi:hypothetical protein